MSSGMFGVAVRGVGFGVVVWGVRDWTIRRMDEGIWRSMMDVLYQEKLGSSFRSRGG